MYIIVEEYNTVNRKQGGMMAPRRILQPADCIAIRREYETGVVSLEAIGAKYGVSRNCVTVAIKRAGGQLRCIAERVRREPKFSTAQGKVFRRMYETRQATIQEIAMSWGASKKCVSDTIVRAGGVLRTASKFVFSMAKAKGLRREYDHGSSVDDLAKRYNRGAKAVVAAIKMAGGRLRPRGTFRRMPPLLEPALASSLCGEYRAGASMYVLAARYRIGKSSVRKVLENGGVNIPDRRRFTCVTKVINGIEYRWCHECNSFKSPGDFYTRARHGRNVCRACQCYNCWVRKLRKTYGISLDDYLGLLKHQDGACAICGALKPGSVARNWPVDHDHDTGNVRGLLCVECNCKLRDMAWLKRAIQYLANPPSRSVLNLNQ